MVLNYKLKKKKKKIFWLKVKFSSQFYTFNFSEVDFESKLCNSSSFHFFI